MQRFAGFAATALLLAACGATDTASPPEPSFDKGGNGHTTWVTTSANGGAGSFRAALVAVSADPSLTQIRFDQGLGTITLATQVAYTGTQALRIDGNGAVIDGAGLAGTASAILASTAGGLDIRDLTVKNAPGSGIEVQIPAGAGGVIHYELTGLTIQDNGRHGVVINDQVNPASVDPPARPVSAGSAAGLLVVVKQSRFLSNGLDAADQDGLRVNEGGNGDLDIRVSHSTVRGNGGDGIEVDERGPGSVLLDVLHTTFTENGPFTVADLDDGLDVDELDAGDVVARFVQVQATDNFEEGLDINENDAGDMRVYLSEVDVSRNYQEGVDLEEDDDYQGGGDLISEMFNVTASDNVPEVGQTGDAGIKIRERGAGDLKSLIDGATANGNAVAGISNREAGDGKLEATLSNTLTNQNGDHGIIYREEDAGDLIGFLTAATSSSNGGAGVRGQEAGAGTGTLTIQGLVALLNGGGATSVSGVTVLP